MSIARTLDGKLSATLALITIIGWFMVGVVEAYPEARPDIQTTVIVIGLAIVAYKFYSMDKAMSKDPDTQKAQIEASVELYLEKLAEYRAIHGEPEKKVGFFDILDYMIKAGESIPKTSDEASSLRERATKASEERDAEGEVPIW